MINETIIDLNIITQELIDATLLDIDDVKKANHEKLVERNELKINSMETLAKLKLKLNDELTTEFKNGTDIKIYKNGIDEVEKKLKELYYINGKLGSIVLPVKEMYKEIIEDIKSVNGGSLIEVMA
ncbi:MAG: hypothetical protein U9Q20_01135 [Campylobacterota bacterium]|nr:hypothetical protein [Campylobacterota bacterium]